MPASEDRMVVIHVIPTLAATYGGPALAATETTTELAQLGHTVSILTTDQGGATVDLSAALRASVDIGIYPRRFPRRLYRSPALYAALVEKAQRADLFVVDSPYLDHTRLVLQVARQFRIPYIFRPHGSFDPYLRRQRVWRKRVVGWLYHDTFVRRASAIHFTAADEYALARPYIYDRPAFVVPLGLDTRKLQVDHITASFRQRWPRVGKEPIILFFGRITEKKGLDVLAAAFGMVLRAYGSGYLVLAGPEDPGMRQPVRRWLADAGVLNRTIFTGMLSGDDKLAVLRDADVFVLPSYTENFGIAILEALAAGTPVVISHNVNIWRDIVAAGVGLVTTTQPDAVAHAILGLLRNTDQRARMSARAPRFVEETYAWRTIAPKLEFAYRCVIEAHRAGHNVQFSSDPLQNPLAGQA